MNKFRENEGMFTNTAPHILEKLKTDQFQLHQDYEIEHNNKKRVKRNDWNGRIETNLLPFTFA